LPWPPVSLDANRVRRLAQVAERFEEYCHAASIVGFPSAGVNPSDVSRILAELPVGLSGTAGSHDETPVMHGGFRSETNLNIRAGSAAYGLSPWLGVLDAESQAVERPYFRAVAISKARF
jgi:hypothetical protein